MRWAPPDPVLRLQMFKDAVNRASKYIRKQSKRPVPTSTDDQIAVCMSFVRALQKADWARASSFQLLLPQLADVPVLCLNMGILPRRSVLTN